jgi:hypothetical protein
MLRSFMTGSFASPLIDTPPALPGGRRSAPDMVEKCPRIPRLYSIFWENYGGGGLVWF